MLKHIAICSLLGLSYTIQLDDTPRSSAEYKKYKKEVKEELEADDYKFDNWREEDKLKKAAEDAVRA